MEILPKPLLDNSDYELIPRNKLTNRNASHAQSGICTDGCKKWCFQPNLDQGFFVFWGQGEGVRRSPPPLLRQRDLEGR